MQNKKEKVKIAIGMSGGVDSSVAALLLKKAGYDVVGLFMKFWHDPTCNISRENSCCDEKSLADARAVATKINIPFYVVDAREKFKKAVTDYFIDEYKNLRTPNPCVVCNKMIKFGWMLDFAKSVGCDLVATGHYARVDQRDGNFHLLKAMDSNKDQSYFLYRLDQDQLSKIIFPLGELTKPEVRDIAKKACLPVHEKVESQEICFIANNDYREFLRRHLGEEYFQPGRIVDKEGFTIGEHQGLMNYTIGQRRGIDQRGIFKSDQARPLYVTGFDLAKNELVVGGESDLLKKEFQIKDANWIIPFDQITGKEISVKIRYRANPVPCKITDIQNSKFNIQTNEPVRAVTPGQSAVFYDREECLGGGIIAI